MKKACLLITILFLVSPMVVLADEFDVVHRYTFDGTTQDVVGGADGTLINNTGNAIFDTGKLVLGNTGGQSSNSGTGDYVDLPNRIISDLGNTATFEAWVTWNGPTTSSWQRIFDFGSSNGGEDQSPGAGNAFYIFLTPRSGDDTLRFGNNHPEPDQSETYVQTQTLASGTEQHVAVVWDGANQTATIYVNGMAAISGGGFTYPLSAINDNNNWLGRAQWNDPMFVGNYNEFRIYQTAQSADEIAASYAAGPDAVIPQVRAVNVFPPNHEDLIPFSAILEWQEPADVTLAGYDVYVSPDSNDLNLQLVSEDQSEATYDLAELPFALLPETEYFWRIDVRDANEGGDLIWTGRTWSFTTQPAVPVIHTQPQDVTAPVGDPAILTIVAEDLAGGDLSYEWFKMVEGGDPVSVGTGDTFEIVSLTLDDRGDYFCRVTNATGPKDSAIATIFVQRGLVHRFSFTEDANDYVGGIVPTLVEYKAGVPITFQNGQMVLGNDSSENSNANNGNYMDLPNGTITSLGAQMTFEFWATWGGPSGSYWQRFFDFGTSDGGENASTGAGNSTYFFCTPLGGGGGLRFGYRYGPTAAERVVDAPIAPVGQQIHVAITWDEISGKVRLYTNGEFRQENDIHFSVARDMIDNNNWIGRAQFGDPMLNASINEFRIYDVALSEAWIKAHYDAGPDEIPENACINPPVADINGDCYVDLLDLALVAEEWTVCGWLVCE